MKVPTHLHPVSRLRLCEDNRHFPLLVFHNLFFTHGTPNFNSGSWGHTTNLVLRKRDTKQYVTTTNADPMCKLLSYID
jgi:hypothetical protein